MAAHCYLHDPCFRFVTSSASYRLFVVTVICFSLGSAKFLEVEECVPPLSSLSATCQGVYSVAMIREMELLVLDALGWSLTVVTPLHFLEMFLADPRRAPFLGNDSEPWSRFPSYSLESQSVEAKAARVAEIDRYLREYVQFFALICLQGTTRNTVSISGFFC